MESSDGFEVQATVACPVLKYNEPGTAYTCVALPDDPTQGSQAVYEFVRPSVSVSLCL
jgi:hypothetical protein